jgi:hypothetical protein
MPAPIAARTRQLARAKPARAADELALMGSSGASAHGARGGQEQVEQRIDAAPPARG